MVNLSSFGLQLATDGALNSNAGAYESVLGVQSDDESALIRL